MFHEVNDHQRLKHRYFQSKTKGACLVMHIKYTENQFTRKMRSENIIFHWISILTDNIQDNSTGIIWVKWESSINQVIEKYFWRKIMHYLCILITYTAAPSQYYCNICNVFHGQSQMANISPATCMPVLGNVHPIKIENIWYFSARSSFYILNW